MAHRRTSGSKLFMTVLCMVAACNAVPITELLDRASQRSDKLHSLSTTLTQELDSHFPPIGWMIMPRPSMCHTSSLQTPNDKEQALQVSESDLLSLARSLLKSWVDPLLVLSTSVNTLPHPAQSSISNKIQELQENSKSLGDGLDILSGKVCKFGSKSLGPHFALCPFKIVHLIHISFLFQLSVPCSLPPHSPRWVRQLRPSPYYPTAEAMTSARIGFPN
uniref:Prolactin n=2 Tax=Percomorphaceae TaxID=1489872 RepID=A0A3Q3J709_MONAL